MLIMSRKGSTACNAQGQCRDRTAGGRARTGGHTPAAAGGQAASKKSAHACLLKQRAQRKAQVHSSEVLRSVCTRCADHTAVLPHEEGLGKAHPVEPVPVRTQRPLAGSVVRKPRL